MSELGTSPPRPDGVAKATGAAPFADDERITGLWTGMTVRSLHARARLRSIRIDESLVPAETVTVTAADLPGPNAVRLIEDDWPILAREWCRHHGEPVALVAAPDRRSAERARQAVVVDYEPEPGVFDLEEAERRYPLLASLELVSGEPVEVLEAADTVVEGTYTFGHQEHLYIECQAMTAFFDNDGRLEVAGTMQCPYYVHAALCHAFGLDAEKVRVRATSVGGGFGGKEDYPSMLAVHAALLARASGRPVRMVYDRHEDIIGTTKRHPGLVRHRTAVDDRGRILAMDIELVLDGGAYTTLSPVVLSRAVLHATGPYRCEHVRVRGKAVRTNTATNGAFRGFGAPQAQFGIERQMDRIARKLDTDPLTVRRLNALEAGDRLPTGQILDESTSAVDCLERVAEKTDFVRRWREIQEARGTLPEAAIRHGLGLSLFFHGAGFTGSGERKMRSPVSARVAAEGRVEILTSMVDMGQGCVSIFPQMVREGTGLGNDDVVIAEVDTDRVPDSGPTVASRATMVVGSCVVEAARRVVVRVLDWWSERGGSGSNLSVSAGMIRNGDDATWPFRDVAAMCVAAEGEVSETVRYEPPEWQEFDDDTYRGAAYPAYSWGASVVEVEIDGDTLEVRPTRASVVAEVGRVVHRTQCLGQIEGGTLQAVGWALLEEIKLEDGRYLNDRLATYIIPTALDSPAIDVELLEKPSPAGPFGVKGVGELPMDGPAPAAAGAIENALGIEVDDIPATPERLLHSDRTEGRPS